MRLCSSVRGVQKKIVYSLPPHLSREKAVFAKPLNLCLVLDTTIFQNKRDEMQAISCQNSKPNLIPAARLLYASPSQPFKRRI